MRRLLMIAYHFPPVGGVGVERTLKHATYLPGHGWQAVVVAPSHSAYRIVDPASLNRIPQGLEIHRAPSVEPAHLRRAIASAVRRRPAPGQAGSADGETAPSAGRSRPGLLRAWGNAAWGALTSRIFFPDDQLLWVPAAVVAGLQAHRRAAVDAVYSSAPPVSGHLAAAILADVLDVPWIADFRDPWMGNAFVRSMPGLHRVIGSEMERSIVARAERTVFATATWRDRYADRYPRRADRFVHIPNGYDRTDLGDREPRPAGADATFRIIHPGSIYGERELDLLLDGVALALEREPGLRELLRVDLVGWLSARNQAIAARRRASLEPVVSFLGHRPRPEALAMERGADAGLILIADDPGRDADVNAKLFEYLGLDLPVLAVAPPGESRAILEGLDWGVGVDPTPDAVADGLVAIVAQPRPDGRADPGGRYDRRRQTARLAELLDGLR
jgi:glycosyltransferase involved in cell wall biosynthesis